MRYIAIPPGIPERTTALQPKEHQVLLGLQAMIAAVQPPLRDTLYLAPVSGSELYKTRREAFTAGIQGCAWLSNEPYQSLRPIGPCEQLVI